MRVKIFHAHGEHEKIGSKLQVQIDKQWPPDKPGPHIVDQALYFTATNHRSFAAILVITYLEDGEELPGSPKPRRQGKKPAGSYCR